MKNAARQVVMIAALVSALVLGFGFASASAATPGEASRCAISPTGGGSGCWNEGLSTIYAVDSAADGHHVEVEAVYYRGSTAVYFPCNNYRGNGTSVACRIGYSQSGRLCVTVVIYEGTHAINNSAKERCFTVHAR